MKVFAPLLLAFPLATVGAPPTSLPDFRERLGDLPNLSLSENLKRGPLAPPEIAPERLAVRLEPPTVPRRPRYVSRMPVIQPDADIDRHMPVKTPDPNVDYKLIVKEPAVESVK